MKKKFLTFGAPVIRQEEIDEVIASMKSGWLGTGPKVAQFEDAFKAYKGVDHAAAVNSCTAALHLSLLSIGLKPGDEVITSSMTFCATINAIIHSGAVPVLADVDFRTMNIDTKQLEAKITPKTKAILPIHFAGRPCDMDALMAIAERHKLKVIEDCAHSIETAYKGRGAGTFGDFGCFSFYVTKNIITGEGGMVLAKRKEDIDRIKVMALHGLSKDAWRRFGDEGYKHYYVTEAGFKYNMMDMQAAIGIHQLKRIDACWNRRQEVWQRYMEAFRDLPLTLPPDPEEGTRHAYHLFTVLIDEEKTGLNRDSFLNSISKKGIGVGVHYLSIPSHPYYQNAFKWRSKDYPNSDLIGRQTVSLPLSPQLDDEDIDNVITAVREVLKGDG
ncbi:MAG: DegT/DnrJ/EryC1/StrS family aminotransferase [Candidatus Omnitrophica bacterium]|nr:DegT/DnrJ/EryC1/StrS family aminotransferase [Candidatus Omnitrophota bacterium]